MIFLEEGKFEKVIETGERSAQRLLEYHLEYILRFLFEYLLSVAMLPRFVYVWSLQVDVIGKTILMSESCS